MLVPLAVYFWHQGSTMPPEPTPLWHAYRRSDLLGSDVGEAFRSLCDAVTIPKQAGMVSGQRAMPDVVCELICAACRDAVGQAELPAAAS